MIEIKPNNCDIIATIGPSTWSYDRIRELVESGMTHARLNFSWGTYDEHAAYIETIRKVAEDLKISIPIIQDLSGPRIQRERRHGFDLRATEVITEKDRKDLEFGSKYNLEYVALSYVGSSDDLRELRNILNGLVYNARIISKIERQEALDDIEAIINKSDVIMVARGDLGDAIAFEKLPFVKEGLIKKSHDLGKPVIVATDFLSSMTDSGEPTRAEVSDIVDGVRDGADALMLSNETASGNHPIEAVITMKRAVDEALTHI